MTELLTFLLRSSRTVVILAVLVALVNGFAITLLLAQINAALAGRVAGSRGVFLFVGLCLLAPASRVLSQWLLVRLGQGGILELRMRLCRQILKAPLRGLEQWGAARLLAALTEDVHAITSVIYVVPGLAANCALIVGCLAYLGWLSPQLLLAVLAAIVVGVVSYQIPFVKAWSHLARARGHHGTLIRYFRALTEGLKELKLHGERRSDFLALVHQAGDSYRRHNVRAMSIFALAAGWGETVVFALIGLLLLAFRGGDSALGIETGFTLILLYMMTPLQQVLSAIPDLGRAGTALAQLKEIGLSLDTQAEDERPPAGADANPWRGLELRGVAHRYRREGEDGEFVLGPLDFQLAPGELVFVVGGNGSGKTTLAKVLVGLYVPEAGEVRSNGLPVGAENLEEYRRLFAVVFAEAFLFEALLGISQERLEPQVQAYLDRLQLAHKVRLEGGRFSTLDLSQGQRKRLALLVAYLEDRPVYVFDEWAADQDPAFKEIFYRQLLPELKARGKAVLVITHDDRYFDAADRIVKLDYGRIESVRLVTQDGALAR